MITTVTVIAAMNFTTTIGIAAGIMLVLFLATKQVVAGSSSSSSLRIARFLNVSIIPLAITFAVIAAVKIAAVLA